MIPVRAGTEHFWLALVVWKEARGESADAQRGVAEVVLNRARRPSWWGGSVEEVIWKAWQFSSMTDPNDPQLHKLPRLTDPSWAIAWNQADEAIYGSSGEIVPGADSYYDDSIAAPAWTKGARFCGKIGRLNFYDVDHDHEAAALVAAAPAGQLDGFQARLDAWLKTPKG